jgi:hypothetical protein
MEKIAGKKNDGVNKQKTMIPIRKSEPFDNEMMK